MYVQTLRNEIFRFADLKDVFAKANEIKSGDQLAGIAARSERERVAAKLLLGSLTLKDILNAPLICPETDDVSRLILQRHDATVFNSFASLTVADWREWILDHETTGEALAAARYAFTPEMAAAVTKIMSNRDLVLAAAKMRVVTRCRNTLGERGVLACRLQPNHPTDHTAGIILSAVDGLLLGGGDAVIGVNPANDSVGKVKEILLALDRLIEKLQIPTQASCLAHMTTQLAALDEGAPLDLLFQSIAGSQKANESFGISLNMLREGREKVLAARTERSVPWVGKQVMYFETGQGSALSAEAHHGVDQLTMEARAYGVAREYDPFIVNSVVGFIGPEYLFDERQITRAGLEDHFMGKLLGLPMGVDVCYTNHAEADQNSADNLLMLLTAAGCNYFMGVPCSDDVMLNYQSTSFHDVAAMRELFQLRPAPEFAGWLEKNNIMRGFQLEKPTMPNAQKLLNQVGSIVHHA